MYIQHNNEKSLFHGERNGQESLGRLQSNQGVTILTKEDEEAPENATLSFRLKKHEMRALKYLGVKKNISVGELLRRLIRKTYPDLEAWGRKLDQDNKDL